MTPRIVVRIAATLALASPLAAQVPATPVPTASLAGQTVAVIPITLVVADPALQSDTLYAKYQDRRATLLWADSVIGDAFVGRAPEVNWVLPPKLRKVARRAPGLVGDPDQMGQAVMRTPNLKVIPDPLRSSLRNLVALTDGRIVMIPAALGFVRDSAGGVRADLSLVAGDVRSGKVLWRSQAIGSGATPFAALERRSQRSCPPMRWGRDVRRHAHRRRRYRPEITAQTVKVLEATGLRFNWDDELAGVAAVDATGTPLPDATVDSIRKNGLALKGPLTTPVGTGFRSVNVGLRKEFELFANVRPAKTIVPGGRFENVDIVLVRENLEGLYIGVEHFVQIGDDPRAVGESMAIVTRMGCERIVRYAFEYALRHGRKKVTIVHKANILKMVSGLFLEVGRAVAKEFEGRVEANDMIVDNTRDAAGDAARAVRRDGDDQHVRRHPERRGLGAGRRSRPRAGRQHRHQCRDLRGGAWQRARHRGQGHRQSVGPDAGRGHDARSPG